MDQNIVQKTVLNLLSASMFQNPFSSEININWAAVLEECRAQSVTSLTFAVLPKNQIPKDIFQEWKSLFHFDIMTNARVSYAHTVLHEIMTKWKIPYVVLKGCVSAQYYDNAVLRTMGDIDFYIPSSEVKRVNRLLLYHGFEKLDNNHEFEISYKKDDVLYELHTKINGIPGGQIGRKLETYFADLFVKAEQQTFDLAQYYAPSQYHHGLIMLLHVARHMITGGIGLRHFCDWAVFCEKLGEDFPKLFESKLKTVGLWRFAQIISQFCVLYLGASYDSWMGKWEKELLDELKEDVFASGDFGHKDRKRADEAKFITSRKQGGVSEDSYFKQIVLSANDIVRKHWRFADKVPVIYPVGWAFFGGRYALRVVMGKRKKMNARKLAKRAEKRIAIYRKMMLFKKGNGKE